MAAQAVVAFKMRKAYAREALTAPAMRKVISTKGKLGKSLYFQRVHKRTGTNARSTRLSVYIGGEKNAKDRWEARLTAFADHAAAREFGRVKARGGRYEQAVAERYGRGILDRATKRSRGEHVLGGDNRRVRSIVNALENR